jgi:hypothetical protein
MSDRMTAEQEEKMRAEFEAWADEHGYSVRRPDTLLGSLMLGDYFSDRTETTWHAWQAATLAAQARTAEVVERAVEAMQSAQRFIKNGVEFGYVRMPDVDCPDPAHKTPELLRASITELQQHLGKKP